MSASTLSWREYERLVKERARLRREIEEYERLGGLRCARQLAGRLGLVEDMLRQADADYRKAAAREGAGV